MPREVVYILSRRKSALFLYDKLQISWTGWHVPSALFWNLSSAA